MCVIVNQGDIVAMASGGKHGEWSTHIRMYEFKWLCSVLGFDFDHLLLVLDLNACGAHSVIFEVPINKRS